MTSFGKVERYRPSGVFPNLEASGAGDRARQIDRLTRREREILTLFVQGMSYAEIADVRNTRPLTIRNATYGIQDKLGIETKQELVVWAARMGLLDDHQLGVPWIVVNVSRGVQI